jgi:hypothetical protein
MKLVRISHLDLHGGSTHADMEIIREVEQDENVIDRIAAAQREEPPSQDFQEHDHAL